MKTVKFYTLGCKVNQYDTQAMREALRRQGFVQAPARKKAGVCVINTCTVTHNADKESLYLIRRAQHENPRARIVVTGCFAENDASKIFAAAPCALIAKNKDKPHLAGLLGARKKPEAVFGITEFTDHVRAFVKIQDGCDNFCSYCKVPLVRGRLSSKPLAHIVDEVSGLVRNGVKEIVLTGICLGSYGKELRDGTCLADVIRRLEPIEGLMRIRLSSIEPEDVSPALLSAMKTSKKVCRHLHIPLQSGDSVILKAMNRKYSGGRYLALIRRIRRAFPGIAITTDVLVGFPGEENKHFMNTVKVVKAIKPLKVHVFPYSPREGTAISRDLKAAHVNNIEKQERAAFLRDVSRQCADEYLRAQLHKSAEVLIEGRVKQAPGYWQGHTGTYVKILLKTSRARKNCLIRVLPERVQNEALIAKIY